MSDPASDPPRLHPFEPAVRFDGGDLDCGSGLLLQIRRRIDLLDPGQLLEIHSTEPSVAEDLPAWCRLTGNPGQADQLDFGVVAQALECAPFVDDRSEETRTSRPWSRIDDRAR